MAQSTIEPLDLGRGDYTALGRAHGRAWGEDIATLFGIRWRLLQVRGHVSDPVELMKLGDRQVAVLKEYHRGLYDELVGMGETSGMTPAQLMVINNYTDYRDIQPEDGGCSTIFGPLPTGPVLAQTWDMHATAEPYARLLKVDPPDGPRLITFTTVGCLAMAGMNEHGVAVCINNLTPSDGRVGVNWPAAVRMMLLKSTAREALEALQATELGSGHNYLIADESDFFSVETTGRLKRITHDDPSTWYCHTNHYLHEDLKPLELPLHPMSTSLERLARLREAVAEQAPGSLEDVWRLMGSHEDYPRSICSHGMSDEPSASKTCGGIICDIKSRRVLAQQGCLHDSPWVEVPV